MSLRTSGHVSRAPTDWEDFSDDKKYNPQPYSQEPIFIGSNIDAEDISTISDRNCYRADRDSKKGSLSKLAHQNLPQNPQYQECPRIPTNPHQLQHEPSSQYIYPFHHTYRGYGPRRKYTALRNGSNAKFRYDPSAAPKSMQSIKQQPPQPGSAVRDLRSVVVAYPHAPEAGKCVETQPQMFRVRPSVITAQRILENPPHDYVGYSLFVILFCLWFVGFMMVLKIFQYVTLRAFQNET